MQSDIGKNGLVDAEVKTKTMKSQETVLSEDHLMRDITMRQDRQPRSRWSDIRRNALANSSGRAKTIALQKRAMDKRSVSKTRCIPEWLFMYDLSPGMAMAM
jgi:hypothetical protein